MEKYAFKMQLRPGCADAYKRRHDAIWPELVELLRCAGISDYSIHLDLETQALFAVLWRMDGHGMDDLPRHPLMRRWWAHMADLMHSGPAGAPLVVELPTLFHLP